MADKNPGGELSDSETTDPHAWLGYSDALDITLPAFIVQKKPTQPPEQHAALHYETNQALLAQLAMPFLRQKRSNSSLSY